MITTKQFDKKLAELKGELAIVNYDNTLDYKETCVRMSKIGYELIKLSCMFQGQEEADVIGD